MKQVAALALTTILLTITFSSAFAAQPARAPVVFRLQVSGQPDPGMIFWVSYGPLGGHFGIIKMHRAGNGVFVARKNLPRGRTTIAYVASFGAVHTRLGPAPAGRVITIRTFQPRSLLQPLPVVRWQAPVG